MIAYKSMGSVSERSKSNQVSLRYTEMQFKLWSGLVGMRWSRLKAVWAAAVNGLKEFLEEKKARHAST